MPLDRAHRVIEEVARVSELEGIVFTGGENLIHREEILRLVRACTENHLSSEIVTNGFWGRSRDAAVEMLEPFVAAGLRLCRISIDRYHLQHTPAEAVRTALDVASELGLKRDVACVVESPNAVYKPRGLCYRIEERGLVPGAHPVETLESLESVLREDWPPDLIALLEDYGLDVSRCFLVDDAIELRRRGYDELATRVARERILVQCQFLATEGRGRGLLGSIPTWCVHDMPEAVCGTVGCTPTINPEGDLFPCCSSWANMPRHRLGSISETGLSDFLDRMRTDPVARFMHYQGPGELVRYLLNSGHGLPTEYSHLCHLCGTLLERYSREQLRHHIEAYYRAQPWRVVFTSRGFDVAFTAESPLP
jgi:hypothetical protein